MPAIVTVISLAVAAVLLVGCFVRLGFFAGRISGGGVAHSISITLDGGRLQVRDWFDLKTAASARWVFHVDPPRLRMPDAKRMFWEFDLNQSGSPTGGGRITSVEVPVSVALLPCMIGPIYWVKTHRKTFVRGFAVLPV